MNVELMTRHHLEFLSLKGGWRGSSESTHVKMPHYWKSYAMAQMQFAIFFSISEKNFEIFTVGVGLNIDHLILSKIASKPNIDHVFLINEMADLDKMADYISEKNKGKREIIWIVCMPMDFPFWFQHHTSDGLLHTCRGHMLSFQNFPEDQFHLIK